MSYAADLLKQATALATLDPNRPNQANVRRSISSAYYAAFHLLIDAAARQFVRGSHGVDREAVRRAIAHDDMIRCVSPRSAGGRATHCQPISPPSVASSWTFRKRAMPRIIHSCRQ